MRQSRQYTKAGLRIVCAVLSVCLLLTSGLTVGAQTLAERIEYSSEENPSQSPTDIIRYAAYLQQHESWEDRKLQTLSLNMRGGVPSGTAVSLQPDPDKGEVVLWEEANGSVTYEVQVPQDGLYEMWIDYFAGGGNSLDIVRGVQVDGVYPFDEAGNITLTRYWKDTSEPSVNHFGDEVRPSQTEVKQWKRLPVSDSQGMYSEPLRFALSAGNHSLTFVYVDQPVMVASVTLQSAQPVLPYSDILNEYAEKGYIHTTGEISFEAESYERIVSKTNSAIICGSDTNSVVTPRSLYHKKYNYIGGANWSNGGDAITWSFTAPQSGLYKITLDILQNGNSGMPAFRQIALDGVVPFREMEAYAFPYTSSWTTHVLSDDLSGAYLFYLREGPHELTMTVKTGDMTELVHAVTDAVSRMSKIYQDIVMITGQSPDLNYEYELDKAIPGLEPALIEVEAVLDQNIQRLHTLTSSTSSLENSIRQVLDTIAGYRKHIDTIPSGLSDLSDSLTRMGDWINTLKYQTLAVDSIALFPPAQEVKNRRQSVWDVVYSTLVSFGLSFFRDYNSVGSLTADGQGATQTLDVWVARGKEWAELLKEVSDKEFALQNNVDVRMNLLPEGALSGTVNTLLLAINAGKEPDVVLGMAPATAMEYAVRNSISDLSRFSDFSEVKGRYAGGVFDALTYQDKVYGLPETMDFRVLFYRTDIFGKLNMAVPDTWDDVYGNLLPKMYQYNLQMYIPALYDLFLYQHGGRYYQDGLKRSALDSSKAYDAFSQMIGNYKDYGVPYSANFFNRFRTGEMPVGIGGMAEYMQITYASPELIGKWSIAQIPGVKTDDGIDRSTGSLLLTVSSMLSTTDTPEIAWKYLTWWNSAQTQSEYGNRVESILGLSARWATANAEAFRSLPWSSSHLRVIDQSREWIRETPYVLGGYFTTRHLSNAIARCITGTYSPRESLEEAVIQIDKELERKRKNFKLTN